MFENILQDFVDKAKNKLDEVVRELLKGFDFYRLENSFNELFSSLTAQLMDKILSDLLADPDYLVSLKEVAAKKGMRFKGYCTITVRLTNSQEIKVRSPYFRKAPPKDSKRKKKRGPNGSGAHLGLDVLGFIGKASPGLLSETIKLAILCPSFEVARRVLAGRGIHMGVKVIRRLCQQLGKIGVEFRGKISLEGGENLNGYTLVIGIDGGRLRLREKKENENRKKGQKRDGYKGSWREPKLFAIHLLDELGQTVKEFEYLYDATMDNNIEFFNILKRYLNALDIKSLQKVVFCGDGAEWIWSGVEKLLIELEWDKNKVYQVLDYTHAVQNLQEIIDFIGRQDKRVDVKKKWLELLWAGNINGISRSICQLFEGSKKEQALKKWKNYFEKNEKRMQYKKFKTAHIPCGSGFVESAIRRVINMRLKSAGSFWKRQMAEYMLFLRSQFLSGRWPIFFKNVRSQTAKLFLQHTTHKALT